MLLYPFVTNSNGFDTGISIANTSTDPIGTLLPDALGITERDWRDTLDLKIVSVDSARTMIDALNKFDGGLLIFDGHGNARTEPLHDLELDR